MVVEVLVTLLLAPRVPAVVVAPPTIIVFDVAELELTEDLEVEELEALLVPLTTITVPLPIIGAEAPPTPPVLVSVLIELDETTEELRLEATTELELALDEAPTEDVVVELEATTEETVEEIPEDVIAELVEITAEDVVTELEAFTEELTTVAELEFTVIAEELTAVELEEVAGLILQVASATIGLMVGILVTVIVMSAVDSPPVVSLMTYGKVTSPVHVGSAV